MSSKLKAKRLALDELEALEKKIELREGLPHLYGMKFYKWAREFFDSTEKECFLVAANQIGKSTTQIRKVIEWAGNPSLWPKLWRGRPNQFWYLYPSRDLADAEFNTKWKGLLPSGKYKDHPTYGWKVVKERNMVKYIQFNSGVVVYFKTYNQDVADLQAGTVYYIACFVAGTKVLTPLGDKNIEEVKVGDLVYGKDGFERVTRTYKNWGTPILIRKTRKGSVLHGTKEHPIWTENRGWVTLGDLTEQDILRRTPRWDLLKNWYFLRGLFTQGTQNIRTRVREIISEGLGSFYMLLCGSGTTVSGYQGGMSCITRTTSPWITELKIWNALLERSTLSTTNFWSGRKEKLSRAFAKLAEKNSHQEHLKKGSQEGVLNGAENWHILGKLSALFAGKIKQLGKTISKDFVLPYVQTGENTWVYNLETEKTHTFFANGILTHNCDEELPVELLSELQLRLAATDGFFSQVFTATLGQDHWRRCMEPGDSDEETHPHARKWNISMYDCLQYEDGSATPWSLDKIERVKARCGTKAEIDRRVYGRFVVSGGLMYEAFDRELNTCDPFEIPPSWFIYTGIDCGSGGERGHPSAMVFVAVAPDYKRAVVFKGWRGDRIQTTASDTLMKYIELRGGMKPTLQSYDWESKDFFTVASRMGETFVPAEKGRDLGKQLLNVLFKNRMLLIFRGEPELEKLITEITTLLEATAKTKAKDDFLDALRYSVTRIPFDWTAIGQFVETEAPREQVAREEALSEREKIRRGMVVREQQDPVEAEFAFWNDLME